MEEVLNQLLAVLPMWAVLTITCTISCCAVLATRLPKPAEDASTAYSIFYKVINFLGQNFGKAANK